MGLTYAEIYKIAYNFHKKYANIGKDDEARWVELIEESNQIIEQYKHTFVKKLITDVVQEIDRVARLKK